MRDSKCVCIFDSFYCRILLFFFFFTTFYSNYWGTCLFSWLYYDPSPARQKPCFPFLFSVSAKVTSNYLTKRMTTLTSYLESYNTLLIALPNLKVLFLTQVIHCYPISFPKTLYCIPFYSKTVLTPRSPESSSVHLLPRVPVWSPIYYLLQPMYDSHVH